MMTKKSKIKNQTKIIQKEGRRKENEKKNEKK